MKKLVHIVIKGMAMGAADVVPGVSGGTLAFILGIYERLLTALAAFDRQALRMVLARDIKAAWRHVDGTFLLLLFSGILLSIFSLAQIISFLLVNRAVPLWAFFNGLIVAALPMLLASVRWNMKRYALLLLGVVVTVLIGLGTPTELTSAPAWAYFGAGFIAICAMIVPGISGSFLLLLMGMYAPLVLAASDRELGVLALFAAGCVLGLLCFSKFLNWLVKHYHDSTMAVLCGVVIGALPRIWPWQSEDIAFGQDWLLALVGFVFGVVAIRLLLLLENGSRR